MNFTQALKCLLKGQKVTRTSWENSNIYFFFGKDTYLYIKKDEEGVFPLLLGAGDIEGKDWIVVE